MGTFKTSETIYNVQRIKPLTSIQYAALKEKFLTDPEYDMTPEHSFAENNPVLTICLIGLPVGIVLAFISEVFSFIPVLCFLGLIFSLFTGTAKSAENFKKFQRRNREYYRDIKNFILTTSTVEEFNHKLNKYHKENFPFS